MVRRALLIVCRVIVPALLLALLALGTRHSIGEPAQQAKLLVLGRMVGERVRICRELTPEEMARIPRHMQAFGQQCEQSLLPYRLRLWIDGAMRVDAAARPAGIRGDRPVYLEQELPLPPARHEVRISLEPDFREAEAVGAEASAQVRAKALAEAIAKGTRYFFEQSLDFEKGQVVRIELDEGSRQWVKH